MNKFVDVLQQLPPSRTWPRAVVILFIKLYSIHDPVPNRLTDSTVVYFLQINRNMNCH